MDQLHPDAVQEGPVRHGQILTARQVHNQGRGDDRKRRHRGHAFGLRKVAFRALEGPREGTEQRDHCEGRNPASGVEQEIALVTRLVSADTEASASVGRAAITSARLS